MVLNIPQMLLPYKTVIFDCDGVLIDINNLKLKAFGEAVSEFPDDIVSSFVEDCRQNFGVSRYIKFKEFFERFAGIEFNKDMYEEFLDKYAKLCVKYYLESDMTPGSVDLLKKLLNNSKSLFVASGSDQDELRTIFQKKGVIRYFNEIYGSPATKENIVLEILKSCNNENAVLIGDSIKDLNVAELYHIDFIYMRDYTVQSKESDQICIERAKHVINNFLELL